MLTEGYKTFIKHDASLVYPNECCGLILDNGGIISCENKSPNPTKSFEISNQVIRDIGIDKIIGFYHSHKDYSEFSVADIAFSEKLHKTCILYVADSNTFKEYTPNGAEIPYIGRAMFGGFLDCVSLFQDYYRRELNILMKGDITHPMRYQHEIWNNKEIIEKYVNVNEIENYLLQNDFIEVHDLKKHDVLLFQMPPIKSPTHIGVFIGEQRLLHHFKEYSEIENYGNAYKRITKKIFRHKLLL